MHTYAYVAIIKRTRPSNCKGVGEYTEGVSEKKREWGSDITIF